MEAIVIPSLNPAIEQLLCTQTSTPIVNPPIPPLPPNPRATVYTDLETGCEKFSVLLNPLKKDATGE